MNIRSYMFLSKIFGSYRFPYLLKYAVFYEKIQPVLTRLIYTTNLSTTPDNHLQDLLTLLDNLVEPQFPLDFIIDMFMGSNHVVFSQKIDIYSSEYVWKVMLKLLMNCTPHKEKYYNTELYQKTLYHCQHIINATDNQQIISCCGLIMLYILITDSDNHTIIIDLLNDDTLFKIGNTQNEYFQGTELMKKLNEIYEWDDINRL